MALNLHFVFLFLAGLTFVICSQQKQSNQPQNKQQNVQQKTTSNSNISTNTKNYDLNQISRSLQLGTFVFDQIYLNGLIGDNKLSCNQKAQFIKNVISVYRKKIIQNNQQIDHLINSTLTNDQPKLTGSAYELQIANQTLQNINVNIKQRVTLANYYISQLQKIGTKKLKQKKSNEQLAVEKLQAQTAKLDKIIYDTVVMKTQVQKKINDDKLKILSVQDTPQIDYQEQYRKYAELSFNATQKVKQKEDQIAKYNMQITTLSTASLPIDIQIDQTKKKIQQLRSSVASQNLDDLNNNLQLNSKNIANKISQLSKSCHR